MSSSSSQKCEKKQEGDGTVSSVVFRVPNPKHFLFCIKFQNRISSRGIFRICEHALFAQSSDCRRGNQGEIVHEFTIIDTGCVKSQQQGRRQPATRPRFFDLMCPHCDVGVSGVSGDKGGSGDKGDKGVKSGDGGVKRSHQIVVNVFLLVTRFEELLKTQRVERARRKNSRDKKKTKEVSHMTLSVLVCTDSMGQRTRELQCQLNGMSFRCPEPRHEHIKYFDMRRFSQMVHQPKPEPNSVVYALRLPISEWNNIKKECCVVGYCGKMKIHVVGPYAFFEVNGQYGHCRFECSRVSKRIGAGATTTTAQPLLLPEPISIAVKIEQLMKCMKRVIGKELVIVVGSAPIPFRVSMKCSPNTMMHTYLLASQQIPTYFQQLAEDGKQALQWISKNAVASAGGSATTPPFPRHVMLVAYYEWRRQQQLHKQHHQQPHKQKIA